MKRSKVETVQPSIKRSRTQDRTKTNIIIMLPKDLQIKLVSFLTLSETLVLSQCSSGLEAAFNVEEVWGEFLRRISPSILALPMNSLASTKDRLKVVLGNRNQLQSMDYDKLRLHYVLKLMGNEHVATLSNPTLNLETESVNFLSGKDFGFIVPYHRTPSASLLVLLIYNGKTSVLLPRSYLRANNLEQNEAIFHFSPIPPNDDWDIIIGLTFKWIRHRRENSTGEEYEYNSGYFTGVESVRFEMLNNGYKMNEVLSNILIWY